MISPMPRGQSGGAKVQVNVHNNAGAQVDVQTSDDGSRIDIIIERTRRALAGDVRTGGTDVLELARDDLRARAREGVSCMVATPQYTAPAQRVLASAPNGQVPLWGITLIALAFMHGNGAGVDGEHSIG